MTIMIARIFLLLKYLSPLQTVKVIMLAGEIQVPALRKSHLATRLFSATVSILNLATALFIGFQQEVLKS